MKHQNMLFCVHYILLIFLTSVVGSEKITTLNQQICSTPARTRIPTISHGQEVRRGYYPWHSSIFKLDGFYSKYICGGTLISSNTVLTAAHCLRENEYDVSPETINVKFDLAKVHSQANVHEVFKILTHPDFSDYNYYHDIGLINLKTSVEFTNFIRPACLSNEKFDIINVDGYIAGFGELASLNEAVMPGRSTDDCRETNGKFFHNYVVPEYNFCAGHVNGTTISVGDSGGGLVFKRSSDKWFVRGIISISSANRSGSRIDATKFAIFADIQSHFKWIYDNMVNPSMVETDEEEKCEEPIGSVLISGMESRNGKYPWHVNLYPDGALLGGTIIRDDIILTSSSVKSYNNMYVGVGNDIIKVIAIIGHPNYNGTRNFVANNIALMKLEKKIKFSKFIRPACFAKGDFQTNLPVWANGYSMRNDQYLAEDAKIEKFWSNTPGYQYIRHDKKIAIGTGLVFQFLNGFYVKAIIVSDDAALLNLSPYQVWISETIEELNRYSYKYTEIDYEIHAK